MPHICFLWNSGNIAWKDANWKWSECFTRPPTCFIWNSTDVNWNDADWLWSKCFGEPPIPPIPPVTASLGNLGVDATTLIQPWLEEPWNPYKNSEQDKERFLELMCRINGVKYEKNKKKKKINVSVNNVKIAQYASVVDIEFKLEE